MPVPNLPSRYVFANVATFVTFLPTVATKSPNELSTITSANQRCILVEFKINGITIQNASVTIKLIREGIAPTPVSAVANCPPLTAILIGAISAFTYLVLVSSTAT